MALVLDVPTVWNSTYLMLQIALRYQKAFKRLKELQVQFTCELTLRPPTNRCSSSARLMARFLKYFYDATNRMSSSLFVTISNYFRRC